MSWGRYERNERRNEKGKADEESTRSHGYEIIPWGNDNNPSCEIFAFPPNDPPPLLLLLEKVVVEGMLVTSMVHPRVLKWRHNRPTFVINPSTVIPPPILLPPPVLIKFGEMSSYNGLVECCGLTIEDTKHTCNITSRQHVTETCIRCNEGMQTINYDEVITSVRGNSNHLGRWQDTATATTTTTGVGRTSATSSDAFVRTHTMMSPSVDMTFCCGSKYGQQCPWISCSFDSDT
jgi:hypothetical protein